MKTRIITLFILTSAFVSSSFIYKNETKVAICTGSSATRYHVSARCRGLNSCKGEIITVTIKEAQKLNKTPCKVCH